MTQAEAPEGIDIAPSPWLNVPISIWILPFYSSGPLKDDAYAPLEAEADFGNEEKSGRFKGGLGTLQVVRYHDSPVGTYDEVLIVPGKFEVPGSGKELLRVTKIYVSQRATTWNGRKNWNIPKHLATFTFTTTPNGSTQLALSPPNSNTPFLKLNLTLFNYIPALPVSTNLAKYVGLDFRLAQPPLPSGSAIRNSKNGEQADACLCGTTEWQVAMPEIWGPGRPCWVDIDFDPSAPNSEATPLLEEREDGATIDDEAKWMWPKYTPWRVGVFIEKGQINFQDAKVEGITAA